jgi:hypothetical protein
MEQNQVVQILEEYFEIHRMQEFCLKNNSEHCVQVPEKFSRKRKTLPEYETTENELDPLKLKLLYFPCIQATLENVLLQG